MNSVLTSTRTLTKQTTNDKASRCFWSAYQKKIRWNGIRRNETTLVFVAVFVLAITISSWRGEFCTAWENPDTVYCINEYS